MVAPPGWPAALPPPDADVFADAVVAWLLDQGPGQWRAHLVLRRNPRALAHLVVTHLGAELEGLRTAYATARADLADVVSAAEFPAVLAAIEAEGADVAERLRQVEQVMQALSGVRWSPKL